MRAGRVRSGIRACREELALEPSGFGAGRSRWCFGQRLLAGRPTANRLMPIRTSAAVLVFALPALAQAPTYFPAPVDPAGNPTTPQKALLGKALFWDEQLSSSRTVACGTCHIFGRGGAEIGRAHV